MAKNYDDRNLQQLFAAMEPKRRLQALKGGFRREANQVRKTAINNLRGTGIHSSRNLEKSVRSVVFKRTAGFRVTIGTKKRKSLKGNHYDNSLKTRSGKPAELVLIWNEQGTDERFTKPKKGTRRRLDRDREAHSTGKIKRYGYMTQTLRDVRGSVGNDLRDMVKENVYKVAKKYGCK